MRKTLVNINTMVRDILHELGIARVNTQVDSKETHILTMKGKWVANNTGRPFYHYVEMRVEVKNGHDKRNVLRPMVTVGFQKKDRYVGKFEHVTHGVYESKNFFFKDKEDLKDQLINHFEEKLLFRYFSTKKPIQIKKPEKTIFKASEIEEAVKTTKQGFAVTVLCPKRYEQLDLFATSTDNE